MSKTYGLVINLNERGYFDADLKDIDDNIVLSITNEEHDDEGEVIAHGEVSLVEAGYMRHAMDTDGLQRYAIQMGFIPEGAVVLPEAEFFRAQEAHEDAEARYTVSVTCEKWDADAVENGEASEIGWRNQSEEMTESELKKLGRELGLDTATTKNPEPGQTIFCSTRPEENRKISEHGIGTYYSLDIESVDGSPVTPEDLQNVAALLEIEFLGMRATQKVSSGMRMG